MLKNLIFTACLSAAAVSHPLEQVQRYPGVQYRFTQNLFDELKGVVFSGIAPLVHKIESLVPTQYSFGDFSITNVTFDYPDMNVSSSQITIDNQNSGVFLQYPKINRHVVHIDFDYELYYLFHITGGVDLKLKDFQFESGFSVTADELTGAPIVDLYETNVDFGRSNIKFTDNVLLESLWFVLDWLRDPAIWIIEWYV